MQQSAAALSPLAHPHLAAAFGDAAEAQQVIAATE
jgi:hypothetical protein